MLMCDCSRAVVFQFQRLPLTKPTLRTRVWCHGSTERHQWSSCCMSSMSSDLSSGRTSTALWGDETPNINFTLTLASNPVAWPRIFLMGANWLVESKDLERKRWWWRVVENKVGILVSRLLGVISSCSNSVRPKQYGCRGLCLRTLLRED